MLKTMLKLYDGLTSCSRALALGRSSFGVMRSVGMKTETYPVDKFVPARRRSLRIVASSALGGAWETVASSRRR